MAFINDGYQTLVSIGGVYFKEKEVQPPGLDAGGMVDTTTMRNVRWRTRQPKHLVTADDIMIKASYDTASYNFIVSTLLGVNQQITVTFPDGHTLTIWGWLDKFKPESLKEGEFPLADVTIVPSNEDNSGNEQPPVYA